MSKSGTNGLRSRTGVPSRRSSPSTTTAASPTATMPGEREPDRVRPARRAGRERPVRAVVEEGRHGRVPAQALVEVGEHPDVGEAVEVGEAAAVGLGELDRRLAARVGDRLERHAVELRVRRDDVADRPVDDGLDRAAVEERLDERERGAGDGQPPEHERAVEPVDRLRADARAPAPCGRGAAPALARSGGGVEPGAVVEEELQHQLRAQVANVLDRSAAPAGERRPAAPRRAERRPGRAGRRSRPCPRTSASPASRSWPSAR